MARIITALRLAKRFAAETVASLVEYTLLVALIAAVAIGAMSFLGGSAKTTLCDTGNKVAQQTATPVNPSRRRSSASAAFGFGTAAT